MESTTDLIKISFPACDKNFALQFVILFSLYQLYTQTSLSFSFQIVLVNRGIYLLLTVYEFPTNF